MPENVKESKLVEKYRGTTVCFTGHRYQTLPFGFNELDQRCLKMKSMLKNKIEELIVNNHVECFISGMAIGVDMICAEIVIDLRKKYPHITVECAIPCESQPNKWIDTMKKRYFKVLEECDKKTLLQEKYTFDCMHKRNAYMVDNSDIVIAVWNGSNSGTSHTVNYAKQKRRRIFILNPNNL